MAEYLLSHVTAIRLTAFASVFVLMAGWEWWTPLRLPRHGRWRRWPANLAIALLGALLVRAVIPLTAVSVAMLATTHGWGLFNVFGLPLWFTVPAAMVMLDLAVYLQHVLLHAVPSLWRLHRMHHADLEFDVTTGIRFHPIEIVLSMVLKIAVVAALGAPLLAVLMFEVLLNVTSMFNHGNVSLGFGLDRKLRWLLVTPDMHRVHHSAVAEEMNSNYGFNLTCWDRLFGTYRTAPLAGQLNMTIGLEVFRDPQELRLDRLLWQPFRNPQRITAQRQLLRWVTSHELRDQLTSQHTTTLIDVRGVDEFFGPLGHLAGAHNIPLDDLPHSLSKFALNTAHPIAVVCFSDKRSAAAAALLNAAGFADVSILRGGMNAWHRDRLPIVHEHRATISGNSK